jgi:predicted ATP-dependent serine protease
MEQRLAEISRLGFTTCVVPFRNKGKYNAPKGLKVIEVHNISEALSVSIGALR